MSIKTVKSDEARTKMRDILDDVTAGHDVVIERYNKPVGVVVPHARWLKWQQKHREEIAQARAEMDAGIYYTWEEAEAELQKRGLLP